MSGDLPEEDLPLRYFEPFAAVCVWFLVFVLLIGPALGGLHPFFQQPVFTEEDVQKDEYRGGGGVGGVLDSPRGVIMFVLAIPIFVGYFFVRPRLVGADPAEFWSVEDDEG